MVRGEHLIDAVWARDRNTLWDGLVRLTAPLYLQTRKLFIGITLVVALLLFVPFPLAAMTAAFPSDHLSWTVLCVMASVASILIYVGVAIEARFGLGDGLAHVIFAPLGGLLVVLGFLNGPICASRSSAVTWKGRRYSMKSHTPKFISVMGSDVNASGAGRADS